MFTGACPSTDRMSEFIPQDALSRSLYAECRKLRIDPRMSVNLVLVAVEAGYVCSL